jgi:hypothetical protein
MTRVVFFIASFDATLGVINAGLGIETPTYILVEKGHGFTGWFVSKIVAAKSPEKSYDQNVQKCF